MGEISSLFCTGLSHDETVSALQNCAGNVAELTLTDLAEEGTGCELNIRCSGEIVGMVKVAPVKYFTDGFDPEHLHPEVSKKGAEEFLREVHQYTTGTHFSFFESNIKTCISSLSSFLQTFVLQTNASFIDREFAMVFPHKEITPDMIHTAITGRFTWRDKTNLARACCLGGFLVAPFFLIKSGVSRVKKTLKTKSIKNKS